MPLIHAVAALSIVRAAPLPRPGGGLDRAAAPRLPLQAAAESIGTATMEADGTIVLQLRAGGPSIVGDALLRYRPGNSGYDTVRNHLPTLRPGATVMVPPFP